MGFSVFSTHIPFEELKFSGKHGMLLGSDPFSSASNVHLAPYFLGQFIREHIMNSENVNSTQNPSASGDSSAGEKPPRSKLERFVVWTVILLLVILAGMEALAQRGYSKSLEDFQTALDEAEEPLTLEDFETKYKSGLAIKSNGSKDGQSTILFKWPSLLRRYEMHFTLVPGDEQLLATYSTNDDPAGMIGRPDAGGDETGDEGGAGPEGPGMVGDGGDPDAGGGPGGGGRGRRGNPFQRLLTGELAEELQLSDEQKEKIQELIANQQPPDESLGREERIAQFRANREAMMGKLEEILDEKQNEKVKAAFANPAGNRPERPE